MLEIPKTYKWCTLLLSMDHITCHRFHPPFTHCVTRQKKKFVNMGRQIHRVTKCRKIMSCLVQVRKSIGLLNYQQCKVSQSMGSQSSSVCCRVQIAFVCLWNVITWKNTAPMQQFRKVYIFKKCHQGIVTTIHMVNDVSKDISDFAFTEMKELWTFKMSVTTHPLTASHPRKLETSPTLL